MRRNRELNTWEKKDLARRKYAERKLQQFINWSIEESTLLEMQNKIKALTNVVQHLINENTQLRDLAVGTLETIKLMPDYDKAIEDLQKSVTNKENKEDGVIEQDIK